MTVLELVLTSITLNSVDYVESAYFVHILEKWKIAYCDEDLSYQRKCPKIHHLRFDPCENAIAERINEILKYEFVLKMTIKYVYPTRQTVKQATNIYDRQWLERGLGLVTPDDIHKKYNPKKSRSYKKNQPGDIGDFFKTRREFFWKNWQCSKQKNDVYKWNL